MRIDEVTEATPEVQQALARLLPQLNPALAVPDMRRVQALMDDPGVTLLFASLTRTANGGTLQINVPTLANFGGSNNLTSTAAVVPSI